MSTPSDSIEDIFAKQKREAAELESRIETWLAGQPVDKDCEHHTGQKKQLAVEATRDTCRDRPGGPIGFYQWEPVYFACPLCHEEGIQDRLRKAGVPEVLLVCSLDNWTPRNDSEKQQLQHCRDFAEKVRKGFLPLLGPVGVGKSHLAVAVMRWWKNSGNIFVKQSTLLRQLRATYSDKKADDPIEDCQGAPLLVLDEMGVSGGGRDEAPMLHEILSHRYERQRPTVITSNLSWDELQAELGERLADRMREAAYRVLIFSGESHRPERRDAYFQRPPTRIEPKTKPQW